MVPGWTTPTCIAQLRALAGRIDALSERVQQLTAENRSLRQQQEQLASERSQLLAKNEQARSRVEAMIARLQVAGAAHVSSEPVNIRILDREYTIGVEPDARDSLMAAAKLLDGKMREVRGANRMAAVDRIAVLAALNLAHELQQLRDAGSGDSERELSRTLDELQRKLDSALDADASSATREHASVARSRARDHACMNATAESVRRTGGT